MAETGVHRIRILKGKEMEVFSVTLEPNALLKKEVHPETDQLFIPKDGPIQINLYGKTGKYIEDSFYINKNGYFMVSAGMFHEIINPDYKESVTLTTVYSNPKHEKD